MANPFPPYPLSRPSLFFLLLITSVSGALSPTTDPQELSSALEALRNHGYTLFTNAITTSDLQYQLLTTASAPEEHGPLSSFTLFAPRDELLFALDMATDAAVYVNTLRYHIVPNHRYTFANLQNLTSPFLDTLLPHYAILVRKVLDGDVLSERATVGVMVDGVRVSTPDLFPGSRITVHGIDGILLSGLNMNQDPDDGANRSGIFPTVEPPAPVGIDRNIPAEETVRFDQNNVPPTPVSTFGEDIPSEGIRAPISEFDRNNSPPAPASTSEGNIPQEGTSQLDRDNIPVAPASTFHGNIPADGTFSPATHHFDWHYNVPGALESPLDGNTPVTKSPKIMQDQIKKLKSLAKKKREKRHRKGRRRHNPRRHRAPADHVLNDL